MAKLIFIHGRGLSHRNQEELRQEWIDALKKGLACSQLVIPEGTEIVLPFYGLELDQLRKEYTSGSDNGLQAKGEELINNHSLYLELLRELADNAEITPEQIIQEMDGELVARGLRNTALALAFARELDKHRFTGELSIRIITNDVFDYLIKPTITQKINDIVLKAIGDEPCVVVAHSLGTVIGYNVLAKNDFLDVQSYITVGSPLGLKAMGTHIFTPLTMPMCIREKWFNAYDSRDIVALKPLTQEHFDIDPEITNYGLVHNDFSKHHGIEGYLGDAAVAKEIFDQLTKLA